jgi:hypothetical protein
MTTTFLTIVIQMSAGVLSQLHSLELSENMDQAKDNMYTVTMAFAAICI